MRKPSRKLRNAMTRAVGEKDYFAGIQRDLDLAEEIKQGMETKFGAAMYAAFEEVERACYAGMASTSPFNIGKQMQLRAELTTVQYVKAQLDNYVVNADTLIQNMEELHGEQGDY